MSALENEYFRMRRAISECNDLGQRIDLTLQSAMLRRQISCYYAMPQREKPSKSRMVLRNIVAYARAAGRAFRSASRRPAFASVSPNGESEDGDGDCSDPPARRTNNLSASISQFRKLIPYSSSVFQHFIHNWCDVPFSWGYSQ